MFTVNSLFSSALRPFSGASRSSFKSPNGIIEDAVRIVGQELDLLETKRVVPLTPALYTGDNLYYCPEDADVITDIAPAGGRIVSEPGDFTVTDPLTISNDLANSGINYATEYRAGLKLLRVQPGVILDTVITLHDCNSLTDSGTVLATGDANSLALNTVFYINGIAAVDFNITPVTNESVVTFNLTTAVDITSITRDGAFTTGVYVPQELVGKLTNVKLRVGSSSSAHYEMTATTNAYGGAFIFGYNIVRFSRRTAVITSTVVDTAINYLRVALTHTVTAPVIGVKIDAIATSKGVGYNLSYYSKWRFISKTTGLLMESPTDYGLLDQVVIDNDAYNLVVAEAQKIMDMELRGESGGAVYKIAERTLRGIWGDFSNPGAYEKYRLKHPSERRSIITDWTN